MSLFQKFKDGLRKTREVAFENITSIFSRNKIDENVLSDLEDVLLEADMGIDFVEEIIENLRTQHSNSQSNNLKELLKKELLTCLDIESNNSEREIVHKPYIIVLSGVNGSGKTTTSGKLAYNYRNAGKSVVIAAADTYRVAAVEQVEIWANKCGARLVKQDFGGDPASVAFDALQSAIARKEDVVIIDTAGRLQGNKNLMAELDKIRRVIQRIDNTAPHESLLVIDATTGQNGISQAQGFSKALNITGLVVTKLDGTARGGVVIPIQKKMGIPVKFIGLGEGLDDLQEFNKEMFVDAILES